MFLFFPAIVLLFVVGWVLHIIGDRQNSNEATAKKASDSDSKEELTAERNDFETELIEECVEECLDQ